MVSKRPSLVRQAIEKEKRIASDWRGMGHAPGSTAASQPYPSHLQIGKILLFSCFASPDYLLWVIDGVCRPYSKKKVEGF